MLLLLPEAPSQLNLAVSISWRGRWRSLVEEPPKSAGISRPIGPHVHGLQWIKTIDRESVVYGARKGFCINVVDNSYLFVLLPQPIEPKPR